MSSSLFTKRDKRFIKTVIKSSFRIFLMILNVFWIIFKGFIDILYSLFKFISDYIYVIINDDNSDILKGLTPRQFEILCGELFRHQGYSVEVSKATNDYGRDIILEKNGEVTFVECKYYSGDSSVSREICQKLIGAVIMLKADKGIVITTGNIHKNAVEVANKVDTLKLMGIKDINNMINKINKYDLNRIRLKINNCT